MGVANPALAAPIVPAGVNGSGFGQEKRVVPATGRSDDVGFFEAGHQLRLVLADHAVDAQLAELVAPERHGFALLGHQDAVRRYTAANCQSDLKSEG